MRLPCFLLFLFAFSAPVVTTAQEEFPESVQRLFHELYGEADMTYRLANALEVNPTFKAQQIKPRFIEEMLRIVGERSVEEYIQTCFSNLNDEFTEAELDTLTAQLQGPNGALLKRLWTLDSDRIEKGTLHNIQQYVAEAHRIVHAEDSTLFARAFPVDLRPLLLGEYTQELPDNLGTSVVNQMQDRQTETLGDQTFTFGLTWLSNNRYVLHPSIDGEDPFPKEDLTINVYEVNGNQIKTIVRGPDGFMLRSILTKREPLPAEVDARLFQYTLNEQYRSAEFSPLTGHTLTTFRNHGSHPFFPIRPEYRVEADLEVFDDPEVITLPTSAGTEKQYAVYGRATFTLNGRKAALLLYRSLALQHDPEYADYLFLPFLDETNGEETYGGGRYLDLRIPDTPGKIVIDFNKAYQPYCAYTTGYFCPVPPEENALPFRIEAGVRHLDLGGFDH